MVPLSVRVHPSVINPIVRVLATGAGPNMESKYFLPLEPQQIIIPYRGTRTSIRNQGSHDYPRRGNAKHTTWRLLFVRAWFGVVLRLSVAMLLSTSSIDCFVQRIFT